MPNLFCDIFLGSALMLLLLGGSILTYTPKYNHPVVCFQGLTLGILGWYFLLTRTEFPMKVDSSFLCDSLSLYAKCILAFGLFACLVIGKKKKTQVFEYYVLVLLGFLGLSILCSSVDLVSIYLCLELQSLAFYILACFHRSSPFSTEAGLKYFLLGAIASAFLLLGASFVYGFSGTTNLYNLKLLNIQDLESEIQWLAFLIQAGILTFSLGILFKVGVVPFHLWLPDVYEGALTPVTTIFVVVPKFAIFLVLFRLLDVFHLPFLQGCFLALGLLSLILGSLLAWKQKKLKRLLAFSGISHVGYALLAFSCNTPEGMHGSLMYIMFYIITSIFLWGLLCCIENPIGRNLYLKDLIGWGQSHPFLSFSFSFVVFSLAGIPPFGGFFAKFGIFLGLAHLGLNFALVVGLLASAIGVVYYLRLIKLLHFEESGWPQPVVVPKLHGITLGLTSFFLLVFVAFGDFVFLFFSHLSLSI